MLRPQRTGDNIEDAQKALVSITNLRVHYRLGNKIVRAVDGVSLELRAGETLGVVGESGSGKSTLGKAVLRLVEPTAGRVVFAGTDLTALPRRALRKLRRDMQMIFQDPYSSLNPKMTIGSIIAEPVRAFDVHDGKNLRSQVDGLMDAVGLAPEYGPQLPREFSGGQRQRVGIARAIAPGPRFIVADEPVSALDVSIQAQILNLLRRLRAESELTLLFISHDLRVVRYLADRVAVMYLGRIVELASSREVYGDPLMPYTQALVSAVPVADPEIEAQRKRIILEGDMPSPTNPPSGCHFRTRCQYAVPECGTMTPKLVEIKPAHYAACIRISPERPNIAQNAATRAGIQK